MGCTTKEELFDVISRLSHDMRAPLNGILGITSLLQENIHDLKVLEDLSELEHAGKYLIDLINDTLDVSRIERERLELNPVVCDGQELLNDVIVKAKSIADEKNISLNINAAGLPFNILYIDTDRVSQAIMNVVGNAVKFSNSGSAVNFTFRNISVKEGIITDELVIEDTGCGMSDEFAAHIFEPFSQENNSDKTSYNGIGLGMTITKEIIDLMGGSIEVESELGKGTKVTILLPMNIATDEQLNEWKQKQRVGMTVRTLEGRIVLLCEDHPMNADITTRLLENKGVRVELAKNGRIGVDKFSNSEIGYYDAILMDIRMPEMDGIEAAKTIRLLDRADAGTIPIIAMTANTLDKDLRATKNAGMNAHLNKPIETEKLYSTLSELILNTHSYQRAKVLIVDDAQINRVVVAEAIKKDFDILEASNGIEALEILERTNGIDAVITDIQMPKMDGIELISRIRADNAYRHVAIIANTQYGEPAQEKHLLELGANAFVYKPTTPKIVEIRLHNILRNM